MENLYKYISSAETYIITTKDNGILHSIVVGETAGGAITVSDNTNTIAVLKASIPEGVYLFDVAWVGFLKVVTAGASKITVCYK